jgi:biotin carboxylase
MRIAVVDGYGTGRILVERLNDAGVSCIHVQSDPSPPGEFTQSFLPGSYWLDLGFTEDVRALAGRLAGLAVDRVVAGCETGVLLANVLAGLLRLPGNIPELARASTDKALMADIASRAGVAVPAGRSFSSVPDAVTWFGASGPRPVVAKPVNSAGTHHVYFCATAGELAAACGRILGSVGVHGYPATRVLVQERLEGVEYSVNTVSHDGRHKVAEVWRYTKSLGPTGGPVYDYDEWVTPQTPQWALVREFAFRVLSALGIRSGAAHTEIMLTGRGPVLIESSARLGGSPVPAVVESHTGVCQVGLLADTLLDPGRLATFDDSAVTAGKILWLVELHNRRAGRVSENGWRTDLESLPSVAGISVAASPGGWLEPTTNLSTSPGRLYLASTDAGQLGRDYRLLRDWEEASPYTR